MDHELSFIISITLNPPHFYILHIWYICSVPGVEITELSRLHVHSWTLCPNGCMYKMCGMPSKMQVFWAVEEWAWQRSNRPWSWYWLYMKGMHFSCHVSSTCCDTHNAGDALYMHALHTLELQHYCSCNIQPEYLASFPGTLPKWITWPLTLIKHCYLHSFISE